MSKRKKPTSEAELQDAIDRMSKTPEGRSAAVNSVAWRSYLSDVLNIVPEAMSADKNQYGGSGADFWENVRQGLNEQYPPEGKREPVELESGYRVYTDKSGRVSIRDESGKFVSFEEAGIERPSRPAREQPSERQIAEAAAYRDSQGRLRSAETGRYVKI